ncbi:MAG TPA: hypothetical protein VFR90_13125 [Methylibium sp.]|uniref:hypothetical protein n=1 Tax=Methylibium sp. TaxID=2067992 RepID=UPI002DBB8EFD|nr:hypothetical protein [Methylibium sp.]HEU4460058.1 hypothetical protein [Methylibium sp.]
MDDERTQRLAAALLRDSSAGVDVVADAVVQTWTRIDHALAPIIGAAGVAAMYRRSLHVCALSHPALRHALGPVQRRLEIEPLRAVLQAEDATTAAAQLGAELLLTFDELLSRMVGPSLTERLLRQAWNDLLDDAPDEDPIP